MQKSEYQAVFNTVYLALLKQSVASKMRLPGDDTDICAYRDLYGNKCAVGHLIPDHRYKSDMEKQTVMSTDGSVRSLLEELFPSADHTFFRFLSDLQTAHDLTLDDWGVDAWKVRMSQIANEQDLEVPHVEG